MSTIVLRGIEVSLDSTIGQEFVTDATRAAEGLLCDRDLIEKYEIEPEDWHNITKNRALIRAIQDERERRVRFGICARESAAKIFVRAPEVLGTILDDKSANPRHRIESARELRATAAVGAGSENSVDAGPKFVIRIDLGGDHVEHYEKSYAPMKPLVPTIESKTDEE